MAQDLTLQSTFLLSPTSLPMPRLGFGVWQVADCAAPLAAAFKAGYRHVDTAQRYGNEAQVGEAFRASGLAREEVFITTKVAGGNQGHAKTLACVDNSLKLMGLDYVDLFLIHDPLSGRVKRLETYRALLEKQKEGKVRSVGVSNYGVKHLEEIKTAELPMPSVNQLEVHPWCQQRPIVEYCKKENIVVEAYSPLTRGQFFKDPTLQEIAKTHSKSPAQILIRWSLQSGFSPLPKSATPKRVEENAQVYDFQLSEEEMGRLNGLDRGEGGAILWNPVWAESWAGFIPGLLARRMGRLVGLRW